MGEASHDRLTLNVKKGSAVNNIMVNTDSLPRLGNNKETFRVKLLPSSHLSTTYGGELAVPFYC